ncbi:hypothetical protein BDR04DRAFT_1120426 [Suillus decipiens]|nr:hypothetical protein BDR04DRAFT_1120426 [Suillus decipiens]
MIIQQIFMNDHKLFTTDQLSAAMARESTSYLDFNLGVNSWRHISIAFKCKLGHFAEELLDNDDEDTVDALQAGHSSRVENRIYGLSPDMLSVKQDLLPQFLRASTKWQLLMHVVPGGLQLAYINARSCHFKQLAKSGRFGSDFEESTSESHAAEPPSIEAPRHTDFNTDEMADHIGRKLEERLMAGMEQRLTTRVVDALTPLLKGFIKEAMQTAHRQQPVAAVPTNDIDFDDIYEEISSLGQNDDSTETPKAKGKRYSKIQHTYCTEDEAIGQELNEVHIISNDDDDVPPHAPLNQPALKSSDADMSQKCLTALQVVLNNKHAQWSSPKQCKAVIATLKQETDIIAMLKIGGGKSMLAILPALVEPEKAVVVVLPLKSLMTDWKRKLEVMKVPFQVYDQHHPLSTSINLILVSTDQARFKTWRQYLAELNQILPVSRIVFDEAHIALLAEDFRVSLQDLHELRQFAMQLVLLTGTLPDSSIPALKLMFGLLSSTIQIRESSNCPELQYIMKSLAQLHTLETKTIQIVQQEWFKWEEKDRGLVFVTYLEDGTDWPFYNGSKHASDASRVQYYQDWRSGKSPVMMCTSAFSTGNDYLHICHWRCLSSFKVKVKEEEMVALPDATSFHQLQLQRS